MIAKRIIVRFKEDPKLWINLEKDSFFKTLSLTHLSYFDEDLLHQFKPNDKADKLNKTDKGTTGGKVSKIDKVDKVVTNQKKIIKPNIDEQKKTALETFINLPAAENERFFATLEDKYIKSLFRTFTIECEETEVEQLMSKLKGRIEVEHIQKNNTYTLHANPNDTRYHQIEDRLRQINCSQDAWKLSEGNDIVVAVIDSGTRYSHIDIKDNIWINPETTLHGINMIATGTEPNDTFGHGTKVTGIITALKNNNAGIIGVAPKSKVMVIKATTNNTLDDEKAISSISKAVTKGAKVINISWGFYTVGHPETDLIEMRRAIQNAFDNKIVVVCSAGNYNKNVADYVPQSFDSLVICVGATENVNGQEVKRKTDSNWGDKVHVCAPGKDIHTTYSTQYADANGTSFSAPQVAGLAALILYRNSNLLPLEVKKLIIDNADNINPATDKPIGKRINVLETLKATPSP
jgi:thermitase